MVSSNVLDSMWEAIIPDSERLQIIHEAFILEPQLASACGLPALLKYEAWSRRERASESPRKRNTTGPDSKQHKNHTNEMRIKPAVQCLSSARRASTLSVQESQKLSLPDGRVLGFAEYGSPDGYPIVFFHGWPSSRLEGWGADSIARRRGARLLCLDRPGFGLSTFQPGRRISDWPADVKSFANHVGLSQFAVLGGSGGGPYALACAHALPQKMMSGVGLMGSAGPWAEAGTQDVMLAQRATALAATYLPWGLASFTNGLVGTSRWFSHTQRVTRWIDSWLESLDKQSKDSSPKDEDVPIPERRERLLKIIFEAFAQGSQATVQEARLLTESWGIPFEDIKYEGIHLWHGTKDVNSPIRLVRYMAERLPRSVLTESDGTHFTLAEHLDLIISELVPELKSAAKE
jgi:pimeloyl-ACP methyl ester carboxylesterase